MHLHDVVIIGGGPSGLYAARLLADSGLDVVVLERKSMIGLGAVCTDIVNSEMFTEFSVPSSSRTGEIQCVRMIGPSGEAILYQHPTPFAAIVDRRSFDREMAASAAASGATIETGVDVEDLAVGPDRVEVKVRMKAGGPRSWRSRMAILATGCNHRLHPKAGLKPPQKMIRGAQAEIVCPGGDRTAIYFGKSVVPGGFGWTVPAGSGRMKVGLLTREVPRPAFERFVAARFPDVSPDQTRWSLGIKPVAQGMAPRSVGDRVLALGEAAGQVKTTTGGGITYGLFGARLAAETILAGYRRGTFDAAALSAYERRWKSGLGKEIAVGLWAWKVYAWMTEAQVTSLFNLARSDGIFPLIQREGDFDWQSGLILDLIRRTSVFGFFKSIAPKPAFLERLLN